MRFAGCSGGGFLRVGIVITSWIYNDAMSEITLTVVGCYATFILAEATLEVSGVIAVVTFGVLLSGYGRSRITPEVEESVDSFWEMMGYIANSVIFVLTGVIIMQKAILVDDGDPFKITAEDWGYLFILYLLITVIRFGVFAGFRWVAALRCLGCGADDRLTHVTLPSQPDHAVHGRTARAPRCRCCSLGWLAWGGECLLPGLAG